METVVYFDPATGVITGSGQALPAELEESAKSWLPVPEFRFDWDTTHRVDLATMTVVPI